MDTPAPESRLGYTVDEFCEAVPMGRSKFYEEARAGKIKLRKIGTKTIVTVPDALDYMRSLPVVNLQSRPKAA